MFRPTEPLPNFRPGGAIAKQYAENTWLVESRDGEFHIEAPGLRIPVDADEVRRAAGQVANLVAAKVNDAGNVVIAGLFTEFTYRDEWAAALGAAAAKAVAA